MSKDQSYVHCFRYMKFEYAQQSLQDNLFKVSKLSEFNDPSECRVRLFNSGEVNALRNYIHNNYSRLQTECIRRSNSYTPESQSIYTEDYIYKEMLASIKRHSAVYKVPSFENIILLMCLAKQRRLTERTDTLFWSHYADSGKGVRIALKLRRRSIFYTIHDVKYEDEVPMFDMTTFKMWMQGEKFNNYLKKCLCTKGSAWSYENELRMIIPCRHPIKEYDGKYIVKKSVKGGNMLNFVKLDYDTIKRIDFGPRVDYKDAQRFMAEVRNKANTSHIQFYITRFNESKYSYCYDRIDK